MMSSDRLETLINQAEALMQAGKYEKAIVVFEESVQIDLRNINALRYYQQVLVKAN